MKRLPALFLLVTLFLVVGLAGAQTSPGYDLHWHVLAGAGADMVSPAHHVRSTLGQLSIGPGASPGHALGAGYWYGIRSGGAQPPGQHVYLPLVLKAVTP
jgi:hypothetical protein